MVFQLWNRALPILSRIEARKVTFTVSGDKLLIQAPNQTIKRIADRLAVLGAKAEPSSPYGAWNEKTEGESR